MLDRIGDEQHTPEPCQGATERHLRRERRIERNAGLSRENADHVVGVACIAEIAVDQGMEAPACRLGEKLLHDLPYQPGLAHARAPPDRYDARPGAEERAEAGPPPLPPPKGGPGRREHPPPPPPRGRLRDPGPRRGAPTPPVLETSG